ncbi:tyrosine-protein phosphatase [Kitasatospora aburaviensis]|uniref:Tyrosine-protein phosphatase n=2 Tax=Streptomycetaceae TaxID=2062 RepID=A0ABW1F0R5_9ACTN
MAVQVEGRTGTPALQQNVAAPPCGGHRVRTGVVYRSGGLSGLTGQDLAKLRRLGIRTVFDLRTPAEQKAAPDRIPAGVTAVVPVGWPPVGCRPAADR